jgi:hypothetical protein
VLTTDRQQQAQRDEQPKRAHADSDRDARGGAGHENGGRQVRNPYLAVGKQLPGRAPAADEQPVQRLGEGLVLDVLD